MNSEKVRFQLAITNADSLTMLINAHILQIPNILSVLFMDTR